MRCLSTVHKLIGLERSVTSLDVYSIIDGRKIAWVPCLQHEIDCNRVQYYTVIGRRKHTLRPGHDILYRVADLAVTCKWNNSTGFATRTKKNIADQIQPNLNVTVYAVPQLCTVCSLQSDSSSPTTSVRWDFVADPVLPVASSVISIDRGDGRCIQD